MIDEDEQWKFSYKHGPTNDCFICQKYKYGLIFVDKRGENNDLIEIKDSKTILEVKKHLMIEEGCDDYVPIICGSVVNEGFKRKL